MASPKQPDERERLLRVELAKRTVNVHVTKQDNPEDDKNIDDIHRAGKEISRLIQEERLEQARERLAGELKKYPDELSFLNLQMALDILDRPDGGYSEAKKAGNDLIEHAIEQKSSYYIMAAITNLGLIAHNEGHDHFSKAMYLTAHHLDNNAVTPMRNLAGWYSRRGNLESAQKWIDKIIDVRPDWIEDDGIVTFLKMDESLHNLRDYEPFKQAVTAKIMEHGK